MLIFSNLIPTTTYYFLLLRFHAFSQSVSNQKLCVCPLDTIQMSQPLKTQITKEICIRIRNQEAVPTAYITVGASFKIIVLT